VADRDQRGLAADPLADPDLAYALTEAGKEELDKLVAAFKEWLATELSDWGADDAKLDEALAVLSRKFVEGEHDVRSPAEMAV